MSLRCNIIGVPPAPCTYNYVFVPFRVMFRLTVPFLKNPLCGMYKKNLKKQCLHYRNTYMLHLHVRSVSPPGKCTSP